MKITYSIFLIFVLLSCQDNSSNNYVSSKNISTDTITVLPKLYKYNSTGDVYLLDKPNGEKILNEKATHYYKVDTYYCVSELDNLILLIDSGEWVKVKHEQFSFNNGWILKSKLIETTHNTNNISIENSNENDYKISKGYTSDPKYRPTVNNKGEYHTIDGKRKQIQYQGSKEQKEMLKEIEKRGL